MRYVVGRNIDVESMREGLETIQFGGFSLVYSESSVTVLEKDGCLFLFHGMISDRKSGERENLSDAEYAYRSWKRNEESFLNDVDGFFTAIVIEEDELKVFRDVFGSKPVYFTDKEDSFAVSSSIEPLLQLFPELRQVNDEIALDYLRHGLIDHRRETFFQDISRLKPREKLSFREETRIEEPEYSPDHSSDLKAILKDHIGKLEPSESFYSPVSGGLDSTVIISEADRAENIHASFSHGTGDDRYIESVREKYGLEPNEVEISPFDIVKAVDENLEYQEEPNAFPAFEAQALLYDDLGRGKTVLLGTGADELFYGYQWFLSFYLAEKIRGKEFKGLLKDLIKFRKEIRFKHLSKAVKTVVLGESKLLDVGSEGLFHGDADMPKVSGIEEARAFHLKSFYFPHLLRSIEKQSRKHDLDVRHAFLSRELLSYSKNHEYHENFHEGLKKYLVRSSFQEVLPEEVYNRKEKTGFVWMTNGLYTPEVKREFLETFRSSSFQERDLIKSRKAFRRLRKNQMFYGTAYRLYCYEKWMQKFIDREK